MHLSRTAIAPAAAPGGPVVALALVLAFVLGLVAACSPTSPTAPPFGTVPAPTPTASPAPSGGPTGSTAPEPSAGLFAFDAESILGYYETLGYACAPAQPSAQAAGYLERTCRLVDPDGRTRVVAIVTDPAGDVASAFTSLTGTASETVLEPSAALEQFAAFLGATLGETRGESLLTWLAANLGEVFETTTLGDLTIATYTESPDDHSRLYLEIANQGFLESPVPSSLPAPSP